MVTNNVTVYQFEVGLDEFFADEVGFRVNVDCVIVVVVKDCPLLIPLHNTAVLIKYVAFESTLLSLFTQTITKLDLPTLRNGT